jgi:hypothetical protein
MLGLASTDGKQRLGRSSTARAVESVTITPCERSFLGCPPPTRWARENVLILERCLRTTRLDMLC